MSFRQPSPVAIARARATLEANRVSDSVHPAVTMLAETWRQIAGVCADLTEDQWLLATDCPGWTVLDQVAHIIGTERSLLGHPLPRDPVVANHVRNDLGAFNEAWVEHYRGWQGAELLMEFGRWTAERLEVMGRLSAADLDQDTITPVGMLSLANFLAIRVIDSFTHEQDIRRAVGRPGHFDDEVAETVVDQALSAMPRAVAREAKAPDGSTVIFVLDGAISRRYALSVEVGRGRHMPTEPAEPTVLLDFDTEAFHLLTAGRITPKRVIDEARVGIEGDAAMGRAILASMNYLF